MDLSRYFSSFGFGRLAGLLIASSLSAPIAFAADVSLKREGEEVHITAQAQEDFAGTEAVITAPDTGTIEVRVAGADFMVDGKRQLFRFEDETVRTVSVSRDGSDGVVRFNIKGLNGLAAAEQMQVVRGNGRIRIVLPLELTPVASAATGARTVAITEVSDLAVASTPAGTIARTTNNTTTAVPESSSTNVSTQAAATAPVRAATEKDIPLKPSVRDTRPESEIPVLASGVGERKQASSGIERLVITLFVLCVVLAAAIFGLKKWSVRRKAGANSPTKIQVLTQHYLGPKKSLAIIQVAGEAVLIGITDHNISMLKTLSLIDDEVPGVVPKNFSDQLDDEGFEAEPEDEIAENFAMKGLGEVRDIVSTRFSFGRGSGKSV